MKKKLKLFPAGDFKQYKNEFQEYYQSYLGKGGRFQKAGILLDIIYCYFRYGSWTNNYFEYRFWEKSGRERNKFLTWKRARKFINCVNGEEHDSNFREKHRFLEAFSDKVYRDWIFAPDVSYDVFDKFLNKHSFVMEKDDKGMFGIGVAKKACDTIDSHKDYYEYAVKNNLLLEECITECEQLRKVHPDSLNTIRVVTFVNSAGTSVKIIGAVFRMGNEGSTVDNARSEGLFAEIDISTGIIKTEAMNFMGEHYIRHPYTKEKIVGLEIPMWEDVKRICKNAALHFPQVRFIGWDVVVRNGDKGLFVELIEGNDRPGVPTLQVPCQKGMYKKLKTQ